MGWKDRATPVVAENETKKSSSWKERALPVTEQESPGLVDNALNAAIAAGRFVDSYTGAPARKAIGEAQEGRNPLPGFVSQIGENPDLAPTGKDIVLKAGVSDKPFAKFSGQKVIDVASKLPGPLGAFIGAAGNIFLPDKFKQHEFQPSPADVAGMGMEIAADPTMLVPSVAAAKAVGRGTVGAAKAALGTAGRGAKVVAEATVPERLFKTAANTASAAKEALASVFKPSQAGDWKEFLDIANKNGIDPTILPESVEFGPGSVISRGSRALREGPTGQLDAERFQDAFFQVQSAAEKRVEKISGGAPLSTVEAGTLIRQGYDDAVERLFNRVDFTYNSVISQIPGASLTPQAAASVESKLAGIEKFAVGRMKRGITNADRAQGQQLIRAIQAVRDSNGSLKQTYEAMQDIGRVAFKTQNALADVPVDKKKMQDLYHTLREAFTESTGAHLGDDIKNTLIQNNKDISDFLDNKSVVSNLIGNETVAPERLFQSLIINGDTKKIAALKEILSPEQFNKLKGTLLESLVKRNPDETIAFGNLFNAMQNKKTVLAEMFEPQEIAEFAEVVKLGNRLGPMVLSTSGTGGSNIFSNMLEGIESSVANRSTIDLMKDSARGRAAPLSPMRPENILPPSKFKQLNRTGTDNTLKYLQILGAPSVSGEQESAAQRRLKENARKRLGQ